MKERPIIFSAEMVRAILEGRKTMTRRVVKPQPVGKHYTDGTIREAVIEDGGHYYACDHLDTSSHDTPYHLMECPYGVPGDRLWVEEKFRWHPEDEAMGNLRPVEYAATPYAGCDGFDGIPWKSPRFMPRWASRLLLEIVSVRVERVQDISRGDAGLEGMCFLSDINWNKVHKGLNVIQKHHWPEENFSRYWDTIYAKNPEAQWDANPWVWVIEFKVVTA